MGLIYAESGATIEINDNEFRTVFVSNKSDGFFSKKFCLNETPHFLKKNTYTVTFIGLNC